MIIGIISNLELSADTLCNQINAKLNSNFQRISSHNWSQCMNVGVVVNSTRKFELLQKLEKVYGNIFVSGNLFLDSDVRSQIESTGGKVFLISPPQADKEDLELVFKNPEFKISKDLNIFVAQEYSDEIIDKFKDSIKDRKDVVEMSLADSIRRAMLELGISPDEPQMEPNKVNSLSEPEKTNEDISLEDYPDSEEIQPLPEPSDLDLKVGEVHEPINPIVEIPKSENLQKDSGTDVYLKMKDGNMVLFIPKNFKFDTQTIEGDEYSTLVFRAPDLGNTGLQKLNIFGGSKPETKSTVKTPAVDVSNMNLENLVKEKSNLDHQIKDARAKGDEDLVKQLRKQRRQVREQINLWGDKS